MLNTKTQMIAGTFGPGTRIDFPPTVEGCPFPGSQIGRISFGNLDVVIAEPSLTNPDVPVYHKFQAMLMPLLVDLSSKRQMPNGALVWNVVGAYQPGFADKVDWPEGWDFGSHVEMDGVPWAMFVCTAEPGDAIAGGTWPWIGIRCVATTLIQPHPGVPYAFIDVEPFMHHEREAGKVFWVGDGVHPDCHLGDWTVDTIVDDNFTIAFGSPIPTMQVDIDFVLSSRMSVGGGSGIYGSFNLQKMDALEPVAEGMYPLIPAGVRMTMVPSVLKTTLETEMGAPLPDPVPCVRQGSVLRFTVSENKPTVDMDLETVLRYQLEYGTGGMTSLNVNVTAVS